MIRLSSKKKKALDRGMRQWKNVLLSSAIVFTAAAFVHWPSTRFGLTLDDKFSIMRNPILKYKSFARFSQALVETDYWGTPLSHPTSHQSYRPITVLSFYMDTRGAPTPAQASEQLHKSSVLLHALCAASVSVLAASLLQLSDRVNQHQDKHALSNLSKFYLTLFAGLLFAVHPVTVEAVSNVSGRAEVLAALFGLWAHILAIENRSAAALFFSCVSLFSKEVGFASIMIVVFQIFYSNAKLRKINNLSPCQRFLCAFSILVVGAGLRLCFLAHPLVVSEVDNPLWSQEKTSLSRWLSTLFVNAKALGLILLIPNKACPDYSGPACPSIDSIWDTRNVFTAISLVIVFALIRSCLQGRLCLSGAPLLWAAAPAALASNIFLKVGFCFAERTYYSSIIGVCLLACLFASRIFLYYAPLLNQGLNKGTLTILSRFRFPNVLCAMCLLLVSCITVHTRYRMQAWASDASLWSTAMSQCTHSSRIANNYGKVLQRSGKREEAWTFFEMAKDLDMSSALPFFNLGMLAAADNRHKEALHYYEQAAKRNPYLVGAFNNAGASYLALRDYSRAAASFKQALSLNPSDKSVQRNMNIALKSISSSRSTNI